MAITKRVLKRTNAAGEQTKRVVWRSRVPDPTKPASASIKIERTFARKQDAERWETAQRHAISSAGYIAASAGVTPLRVVADAWREQWDAKPLSPKTQQGYASLLENHIIPRWGDVKVSAIDAKGVQAWINDLAKTRHPETTHHCYTALRQTLKVAVAHKLITTNPCTPDAITLPSKKAASATHEQLALTASELRQLIDTTPAHYKLAVKVAGLCGLRAGELWAIRRQDIDLLHAQLTIRFAIKDIAGHLIAGPTKTHATRSLSIPAPLIADLEKALASPGVKIRRVRRIGPTVAPSRALKGGYPAIINGELDWTDDAQDPGRLLFTTPGGSPIQHTNFYERIYRPTVAKLWPAGHRLHDFRFHDLRHTAASLAIAATGNLGIVQKRLGHSSITTTFDRYHHLLPDADKSLADALGAMFDATDEPASNVVDLHKEAQ
jgi:integrase